MAQLKEKQMQKNITSTAYNRLEELYNFLNDTFFEGKLPSCLITLQRTARAEGFFKKDSFLDRQDPGVQVDEISLNPSVFRFRSDMEISSTLAHEMAHLWQYHFGKPGNKGYHNREWGNKMEAIGLMPSATGAEGGKKTGQKMSDYIIQGGIFEKQLNQYLHDKPCVRWQIGLTVEKGTVVVLQEKPKKKKVKYHCPSCKQAAWAKPDAKFICGNCEIPMQPEVKAPLS